MHENPVMVLKCCLGESRGSLAKIDKFFLPTTAAVSRKLLKRMSDFFFFQAQLYVDVYYHAKKSRKNPKTKIYIGIEITRNSAWAKNVIFLKI